MKFGKGAILGLVGGLLGMVGVFLPWITLSATVLGVTVSMSVTGSCLGGVGSISVGGVSLPCSGGSAEGAIYAWGTLGFSLIGLILVVLGKRSTSMMAMIFGLLVVVIDGVAIVRVSQVFNLGIPGLTVSPGIGIILCIVGGVLLLIGGFLAMGDAKKAAMAPPMAAPPPPM